MLGTSRRPAFIERSRPEFIKTRSFPRTDKTGQKFDSSIDARGFEISCASRGIPVREFYRRFEYSSRCSSGCVPREFHGVGNGNVEPLLPVSRVRVIRATRVDDVSLPVRDNEGKRILTEGRVRFDPPDASQPWPTVFIGPVTVRPRSELVECETTKFKFGLGEQWYEYCSSTDTLLRLDAERTGRSTFRCPKLPRTYPKGAIGKNDGR